MNLLLDSEQLGDSEQFFSEKKFTITKLDCKEKPLILDEIVLLHVY